MKNAGHRARYGRRGGASAVTATLADYMALTKPRLITRWSRSWFRDQPRSRPARETPQRTDARSSSALVVGALLILPVILVAVVYRTPSEADVRAATLIRTVLAWPFYILGTEWVPDRYPDH